MPLRFHRTEKKNHWAHGGRAPFVIVSRAQCTRTVTSSRVPRARPTTDYRTDREADARRALLRVGADLAGNARRARRNSAVQHALRDARAWRGLAADRSRGAEARLRTRGPM